MMLSELRLDVNAKYVVLMSSRRDYVRPPGVLFIGVEADWLRLSAGDWPEVRLRYLGERRLTKSVLKEIAPSIILSQLFGRGPDALEIVGILNELQYAGRYYAVGRVASSQMIRNEIRQQAPSLIFDIIDETDLPTILGGHRSRLH